MVLYRFTVAVVESGSDLVRCLCFHHEDTYQHPPFVFRFRHEDTQPSALPFCFNYDYSF